jgi:DNA polymerase III epsilon subunit-like protein
MSFVMVDVESDGSIPGDYSMISFGAVLVTPALDKTFYGRLRPISERWVPQALAISGFSREEVLQFDDPSKVMDGYQTALGTHRQPPHRAQSLLP